MEVSLRKAYSFNISAINMQKMRRYFQDISELFVRWVYTSQITIPPSSTRVGWAYVLTITCLRVTIQCF